MDKPKAPDDARGWSAIEIFLFTNGQEYSPPRKYHLKTEELRWWDATLGFLARSQFGSLHSNIELYTLDGKKITTPLDLTNDAAYVAVEPPDAFIQTGYEKYLLKASRSREKRHEKLNNKELAKTGNYEANKELVKLNLKIPYDMTAENEKQFEGDEPEIIASIEKITLVQLINDSENHQQTEPTNNSVRTERPELLQRGNPSNNTKNKILRKIYPYPKSKENGHAFNKKRTTSFPKNLIKSSNNMKRLTTSSNKTDISKPNVKEKAKSKDKPQSNNTQTAKSTTERNNKISDQLKIDPLIKNSSGVSMKDFTVISDVYKNVENDIQSVFLDADRKTALLCNGHKELARASENIHEFGEKLNNCLKTNEKQRSASNLSQIQPTHILTQPGTLNINLNIGIKGYNGFKRDEYFHANKCKTFITHMNPEKSSQVNLDINLSRDPLNFEDEVLLRDQPSEAGLAKTCDRKIADNKSKVIVHCKCDVMKPENTPCDFNDTDHYIYVIPTEKIDKLLPRSGLETHRGFDKETKELLLHSCIRIPISNSEILIYKKVDSNTRHKESISQEAPLELNSDNIKHFRSQGDTKQSDDCNKPNQKVENFTQTDWSNILLQVKCHEDGHYTFHLPPLYLLAQYNLL